MVHWRLTLFKLGIPVSSFRNMYKIANHSGFSPKQEHFLYKIPVPVEILLPGRYLYFYNPRWPFYDWYHWLGSLQSFASQVKVAGHNQSNKSGWKTIRLPLTAHYILLTILNTQQCHNLSRKIQSWQDSAIKSPIWSLFARPVRVTIKCTPQMCRM